ncbi:molybdenum cofactor guanylyltransferase [Polaromonas sp.]|nr:molybdenum cofactor guanylyltransferase [Polaromonas sp.]
MVELAVTATPITRLERAAITGVILAGGRGSRMGGVDKGLQNFNGQTLVWHTLQRLAPQVGQLMISANRHLSAYQAFGPPVWPDGAELGEYAGPLAGFITALAHCETPFLLTVPCDTPLFPTDLAARLAEALHREGADLAIASAPDAQGQLRVQPVFCLLRCTLLASLVRYAQAGGRKIQTWTAEQKMTTAAFNQTGDGAHAFFNINTLVELQQLESQPAAMAAKP